MEWGEYDFGYGTSGRLEKLTLYVMPSCEDPQGYGDLDFAVLVEDERLPEKCVFVDHTGFIGEMPPELVDQHDDWIKADDHFGEGMYSCEGLLKEYSTRALREGLGVQVLRAKEHQLYYDNRLTIMLEAQHHVDMAKKVIAEALRSGIPPKTYARVVGGSCHGGLNWIEEIVAEVWEEDQRQEKKRSKK